MLDLLRVFPVIVFCLVLSFVFSGSEVALFSPWKEKDGLSDHLRKRPYALMSAILLGNTLVNSLGAAVFVSYLHGALGWPEWVVSVAEIIIFTGILLVFSEITPKVMAMKTPRRFASWSSWIVWPFFWLFYPLLFLLEHTFGRIKGTSESTTLLEVRRLSKLMDPAALDWHAFEDAVGLFVGSVSGAMTPRSRIKWARLDMRVSDLRELVRRTGHGRFPVMGKSPDDVKGYIYCGDLLGLPDASPLRPYMRKPLFILDTTKLIHAFEKMAEAKEVFAIVVDEFGGTVGLLTARDLAGHLLGGLGFTVKRVGRGRFIVSGHADVGVIERITGKEIGPPEEDLTGLLLRLFGRVPQEGDQAEIEGVRITVLEKSREEIETVKVEVIR